MRNYILFCVVCLQLGLTYGEPAGVGVYAYQDSAGNRYGGTYDLDDAQFYGKGKNRAGGVNTRFGADGFTGGWNNFIPPFPNAFGAFDDFAPQFFNNLENILQDVSERRSFDSFAPLPPVPPLKPLPSLFPAPSLVRPIRSFAPFPPLPPLPPLIPFRFWPPLPMRFRPLRFDNFGGFGGYNSFMSRPNSAFAGGAIGPGFTHQIAAINPENPNMQNVNVLDRFADTGAESPRDGYYSVSSSSYASSSNVDGKQLESRGAETVVNKNGQITRYKVQN